MNENEIILTANCIKALAGKPDSDELIQHLLKQMCMPSNESYPQQSVSNVPTQEKKRPARIYSKQNAKFWIFTKKEIEKMPQNFRKIFKAGKVRAHVRLRKDNIYEIKWQFNHNVIIATSKHLDVCKEKFLEKLSQFNPNYGFLRERRPSMILY